jgi:hypothetical protein
MSPLECAREPEVVQAILTRRRPEACDTELRLHAERCEVCRDVIDVTRLFRDAGDFAACDVRVPASGQVWWRAAVRARLEGTAATARPMTWAHGLAAACTAGLAVGLVGLAWPTLARGLSWLGARAWWSVDPAALDVVGFISGAVERSLPIAIVAAAGIVLAPLGLYLALSDD